MLPHGSHRLPLGATVQFAQRPEPRSQLGESFLNLIGQAGIHVYEIRTTIHLPQQIGQVGAFFAGVDDVEPLPTDQLHERDRKPDIADELAKG